MNSDVVVPAPRNEPVLSYAPGTAERTELKRTLARLAGERVDIPLVIGGCEIRTGRTGEQVMPHDHGHVLATYHLAGEAEAKAAVDAALKAQREWARWPWEDRAAVFLRAAELLAGRWRPVLNGATMLGQSKTPHQAEIDAACELIDFWRFNAHFAQKLFAEQPESAPGVWNRMDHRPLEGFVYAVTPFNFTSIAGNLPTAPALLGNVAIWKPAATAVYSGYYIVKLLEEAGLPPGVINFLPGDPVAVSKALLDHRELAGVHFTGSTGVFQSIWRTVGDNIDRYRSYPRLVGETGGKDFILAHASADAEALAAAIVRGGFEYQGQKCSAASRIFVPDSLWPRVKERTLEMLETVRVGDPTDFRTFMGAVIDRKAYDKITEYIKHAQASDDTEVVFGGKFDDSVGYFIDPTLVEVRDPAYRLLCEEVFGPVVSVHVYPESRWTETLRLVDQGTPYALTGAVFATDRRALLEADQALRFAAGNYYINDKPTGAVVGQQPFGGGRASGTNDKAGSILNLVRWVSPRTIKETFAPPRAYEYPFMEEK
ncbi:MAG TPA: L-glutamate gamma-semialdehyde dehydrogenase [Longimicrobiaceae bacterium]|nr:L-glutamate gamma-semialdehyde dehydrogenase [Longimicrobiaceae bacterium]